MVATRSHPKGDFPTFEPSPTKKSSRASTASPAPMGQPDFTTSSTTLAKRAASNVAAAMAPPKASEIDEPGWCHTASNLTLLWLAVSMPLVIWDIGYMVGRPHTMHDGWLQWPIWKPYELYASIDHVYGWPGWEGNDGFGSAQTALNVVEIILYSLYLKIVYSHGISTSSGTGIEAGGLLAGGRKVRGQNGNRAVLIGFAAAVMTASKTALYFFVEHFSGYRSVAHNDWVTLFFLYIVMNGLWVAFPTYMAVVFGADIMKALDIAAETSAKKNK